MKTVKLNKVLSGVILLTLSSTLITACGSKNSVKSDGSGGLYGSPVSYGSGVYSQVSGLRSQYPCVGGAPRIELHYGVQNAYSSSTLGGTFTQGGLGGSSSEVYVGTNSYNDLMIVSKITSGSSVVGYNIDLSYCSSPNGYLLRSDRQFGRFSAPNGITLIPNAQSGMGKAVANQTQLEVLAQGIYPAASASATFYGLNSSTYGVTPINYNGPSW